MHVMIGMDAWLVFGSRIEGDQVGVVEEQFVELYQEEIFEEGKCNIGFLVPMNII